MNPAQRNVWLELGAFALILISLVILLGAVVTTATFVVSQMLPNEPPIEEHGLVVGAPEALVAALCFLAPAAALWTAAWGLRALLSEPQEEEDGLSNES